MSKARTNRRRREKAAKYLEKWRTWGTAECERNLRRAVRASVTKDRVNRFVLSGHVQQLHILGTRVAADGYVYADVRVAYGDRYLEFGVRLGPDRMEAPTHPAEVIVATAFNPKGT